jgi:integrase
MAADMMVWNLTRDGAPVKVVSERLGHKSVTFTIDAYVHVLDEQNEAAAETLDAVVSL